MMHEIVIDTNKMTVSEAVAKIQKAGCLHLCTSNAGLSVGKQRLTFVKKHTVVEGKSETLTGESIDADLPTVTIDEFLA